MRKEQPVKYRKKPVVVEAMLVAAPFEMVADWSGAAIVRWGSNTHAVVESDVIGLDIATLEGVMRANLGDYIIKGVHGEFYPCKPDIFAETYDSVDKLTPHFGN